MSEKSDVYEIFTTIIIGLATVLGALCAYYSSLWSGDSQTKYIQAINGQSTSNTQYLEVLNDYTQFEMNEFKDDIIYAEWKKHLKAGDPDADYYFSKLSEGFQKDLQEDAENISNYEKQQEEALEDIMARFHQSDSLSQQSKQNMEEGQKAGSYGDKFTFATVLFTVVLFFGGLASLKTKKHLKKVYLGLSLIVFILASITFLQAPFPG